MMITLEVADDFLNYDEHVVAWLVHALLQEQSFAPRLMEAGSPELASSQD